MSKSYIKCLDCGTVNLNNEYCSNCGAILDVVLKRRLESEKKMLQKIEEQEKTNKKPNKIEAFLKNGAEHPNILMRILFQVVYSIWIFFALIVGGLIALFTAAVAG
ncbi:hypothetical protein FQU23_003715 [Flavobacterium sp. XN-5]|uniref:hypothetical protein n=1 Tax=Flavobacterium sp. XN-5 TaxID=2599390 RepID=UPI0011CAEFA5|nr:hypothetical protein [Flavobacterium sp. XN-5]NGY36616.1 hypothetical protein [Flavobacterium sp. XN-5]